MCWPVFVPMADFISFSALSFPFVVKLLIRLVVPRYKELFCSFECDTSNVIVFACTVGLIFNGWCLPLLGRMRIGNFLCREADNDVAAICNAAAEFKRNSDRQGSWRWQC